MTELRDILEEEYIKQIGQFNLKTLLEIIEEAIDDQSVITEKESLSDAPEVLPASVGTDETLEMLLKMIPDIAVSEIGWSDVRTVGEGDEAKEIKGPERQLLEGYLKNIAPGGDFAQKIQSISKFYSAGAGLIAKQAGEDRTKKIVQAISYLVFYKTLTKVITNFNASSAGFSFESFLAALVNGYQIPANTGTIADYIDRSTGKEIPVSLKLYREGGLEVGGSYTDLVNDLVEPKYHGSIDGAMRYVVCTKTLEGDDLEQEGHIDFYQFDFSLKNVFSILVNSKEKSRQCIMLPRQIVSALLGGQQSGVDMNNVLPGQENAPSDEELETEFTNILSQILTKNEIILSQAQLENLVQDLDYGKSDNIFKNYIAKKGDEVRDMGVVRGRSLLNRETVKDILDKFDWYKTLKTKSGRVAKVALLNSIGQANAHVIKLRQASKLASERTKEIARLVHTGEFLSPEESSRQYGLMGEAQRKIALKNSWGYLTTAHFSLNQAQATSPQEPTKTIPIGTIMIGRKHVGEVLKGVRELLNTEVAEIFQSLKILSDSLNQYFAGGLENNDLATAATTNATNISAKEILSPKPVMQSWTGQTAMAEEKKRTIT
tara:strand:+ start:1241 stop:3049 length:1809 start_codon:yes stop_codon:yes gene_type:complete